MCQLKVKVTIEGQMSNNQILDIMSCPLCKSYTYWNIFFNLGSIVHLTKRDVQNPYNPFAGLRSRSHLKVKIDLEKIHVLEYFWN